MSGYPLQSVLDLRRREEDAAATRLADATRVRVEAEGREAALVAVVAQTQEQAQRASMELDHRQGRDDNDVLEIVGAVASAQALFAERRRHELKRARAALTLFRRGPLADARALESTARANHLAARRTREAFEKHAERHGAAAQASAQRRDEEILEDIARANRHGQRRETDR